MERKIIKIFLASSITDLKEDRLYLGDFFNTLNMIYENQNLFFKLIKCENYDSTIALSGKQAQYDQEIRSSELCFFLFFKKVGDFTKHEFEVAMESFRAQHKPKVVTYIKYINSLDEVHQDVKAFMDDLETNLKHYYNVYDHIDTLKLQMLLQIKNLGLDSSNLTVQDGLVSVNGEVVTSCASIPMFQGNVEYASLKSQYQAVDAEYVPLQARYSLDTQDTALQKAYFKIASQRAKLKEQIEKKEKELLEYAQEVSKKSGESNLTPRQISAYRLVEQGKYKEALRILDKAEIFWNIDRNLQDATNAQNALQQNVNELVQRATVLKAQSITPDVIADIYETYEKACDITINQHLDKTVLYHYASFLWEQNNYTKALEVAQQYLYRCDDPSNKATTEQYGNIYGLLALLYNATNHMEEAEEYHKKVLNIRKELCEINAKRYLPDLAVSYHNLAILYGDESHSKEGEEYYKRAIEIWEQLEKKRSHNIPAKFGNCVWQFGRFL